MASAQLRVLWGKDYPLSAEVLKVWPEEAVRISLALKHISFLWPLQDRDRQCLWDEIDGIDYFVHSANPSIGEVVPVEMMHSGISPTISMILNQRKGDTTLVTMVENFRRSVTHLRWAQTRIFFNLVFGISDAELTRIASIPPLKEAEVPEETLKDNGETIWSCFPTFSPRHIHVAGCGGLGSRLVPLLTQFLGVRQSSADLTLWDFDTVETKNLERQNFIPRDVGYYKSTVLATRYAQLYPNLCSKEVGFNINSVQPWSVVFLALDSMEARKEIISGLMTHGWPGVLVIDGGNADTWGQVATFTATESVGKLRSKTPYEDRKTGLTDLEIAPIPIPVYTNATGQTGGLSCGDMDQSQAINALIAAGMFASFQNWWYENPLQSSVVYYSLDGRVRTPMSISEVIRDKRGWETGRSRALVLG